jgi:two-component system CheB/CheR fusion protein
MLAVWNATFRRVKVPLRSNDPRFRLLVESTKDIIWSTDMDLNVTYVSPSIEQMLGFTPELSMARNLMDSMTAESSKLACETLANILDAARSDPAILDRPHTIELEFFHRDGGTVWTEVRATFMLDADGRPAGIIGVTRDINDRHRAEEQLRISEERYRRLVETTSDWVWEVDDNAIYTYASPKVKQLLGYEPEEIIGRSAFELMPPEEAERLWPIFAATAEKREPIMSLENAIMHKNGERMVVETTGLPLLDAEGRLLGYQGCDRDVTARKHAERRLHEYASALESANQKLQDLCTDAQIATQAKSAFLANMSHEIRTPMTSILGFADELLGSLSKPADIEAAATIKRNGEYLLKLINNILDLSKIEAGRLEVETIACSPATIALEAVDLIRPRAAEKKLSLDVAIAGAIPERIQTDPHRLRQILINLLGNAVKFTASGGVRLTLALTHDANRNPLLQFEVSDTGIGMSAEQIASLFQPFTQADASTARRFGGTGLGLAISKRLAELLGGDITVRGAEGRGCIFTLSIAAGSLRGARMIADLSKAVTPQPAAEDAPSSTARIEGRLLLVEDGPDNQRLIGYILEKAGAVVTMADNGQIGVEIALDAAQHGEPFDLILMDMQMPVLDGYEAARKLRAAGMKTPIVALTAHAMSGDRMKCLEAGCTDYVTKPIDRAALTETIRRCLRQTSAAAKQ